MRRFRDLISAHKRFSFGLWIVVLVAVVAGAQWQLTSGGSMTRTQVLGAATKKPDTTPPVVSVSFPAAGVYGPATWTGCSPAGVCGSASDDSGVAEVDVAVQQAQVGGQYWNGSGFTSTDIVWSAAKGTTSWNLPFALPAAGSYRVSVRATDKAKPANTTNPNSPTIVTFTVDRTPPVVPTITQHPDNPTRETTATFGFTNTDTAPVTFQCKLDAGAFASCTSLSPTSAYSNLAMGDHTFSVRAVDTVGNPSATAEFPWTIATGNFTISTADPIPALYPGMTPATLNLTFTNPYNFTLNITSVRVGVQQVTYPGTAPNPDCVASESLSVTPPQPASWTISVPPHLTMSLSDTTISQAQWPHLQMLNLTSNQDACKDKTFTFIYSGTASKQ